MAATEQESRQELLSDVYNQIQEHIDSLEDDQRFPAIIGLVELSKMQKGDLTSDQAAQTVGWIKEIGDSEDNWVKTPRYIEDLFLSSNLDRNAREAIVLTSISRIYGDSPSEDERRDRDELIWVIRNIYSQKKSSV